MSSSKNAFTADSETPQQAGESEHAAIVKEPVVSMNWLFFDEPNQKKDFARNIRIPRSLFDGPSQYCRNPFAAELLHEFSFEADKSSIRFWKPKEALLLPDIVRGGWRESIEDIYDVFQPISLTLSFGDVLNIDINRRAEDIHLVVTAEGCYQSKRAGNRKRPLDEDTIIESWPKRLKHVLPSIYELPGALRGALTDLEKVPITEIMFTQLISAFEPDRCTANDVGSLFTIGEYDPSFMPFILSSVIGSPPDGGTESSFISFWDDNIRKTLQFLMPDGTTVRNSDHSSATVKLCPDFGFVINKICLFRGEEKGPEDLDDPKTELANNFNWVYDLAPYVLGYYCNGSEMTLVAITAPSSQGSPPHIHDLISINLRWRRHRIANICHLINLAKILPRLSVLVRSPVNDFQQFRRENSTVEITSRLIVKTYTCNDAQTKIGHLRRVYSLLADHKIQNTDAFVFSRGNTVYMGPRGLPWHPQTEKELRECLSSVLESLIVAHQVPIYHCDIRWENVIRKIEDPSKWFLIDWEDAAVPPTKKKPFFAEATHSPAILKDGYGAEVDIWAVGYLIKTCRATDYSTKLWALGERICVDSAELSAVEVLGLLDTSQSDSV